MAKRMNASPAKLFIEWVALMPWWGGLALAAANYFVLGELAQPVSYADPVGLAQSIGTLTHMVFTLLAGVGQYLVPLACVIGAALSARHSRRRRVVDREAARATDAGALDTLI